MRRPNVSRMWAEWDAMLSMAHRFYPLSSLIQLMAALIWQLPFITASFWRSMWRVLITSGFPTCCYHERRKVDLAGARLILARLTSLGVEHAPSGGGARWRWRHRPPSPSPVEDSSKFSSLTECKNPFPNFLPQFPRLLRNGRTKTGRIPKESVQECQ